MPRLLKKRDIGLPRLNECEAENWLRASSLPKFRHRFAVDSHFVGRGTIGAGELSTKQADVDA
jgi:hypothetical protein